MGATSSQDAIRFHAFIKIKYTELQGNKQHATIGDIAKLQSSDNIPVDLADISILYRINTPYDGRFTLEQFIAFSDFCHREPAFQNSFDFRQHIRSVCMKHMWESSLRNDPSGKSLREWFMLLLHEDRLARSSNALDEESIRIVYCVLHSSLGSMPCTSDEYYDRVRKVVTASEDPQIVQMVLDSFLETFFRNFSESLTFIQS